MLQFLKLKNFRNFESAEFDLSGFSTVFSGANGKGKTSILEAIYFISTLRSFRTSRIREIKRMGARGFDVSLNWLRRENWETELRVEEENERKLYVDGIPVKKASEFADKFKCVAFLPDDPVILTGSPVFRRRFLDMFLCMLDREYFFSLQKYSGALKSRNYLLKSGKTDRKLLDAYAVLLAEAGSVIVLKRKNLLNKLEEKVQIILEKIRPETRKLKIISKHSPETEDDHSFLEKLFKSVDKDIERYSTTIGPHVDDFDFLADKKMLRYYGSRGQCRITSLALKLAELEMLSEENGKIVVLVDDAVSDLDQKAKESFFSALSGAEQVFYAFTELPNDEFFRQSKIVSLSACETN